MNLRFTCGNCDSEIVTQHLKVGKYALCIECNKYNIIPDNEAEIDNPIQTKIQELDELAKRLKGEGNVIETAKGGKKTLPKGEIVETCPYCNKSLPEGVWLCECGFQFEGYKEPKVDETNKAPILKNNSNPNNDTWLNILTYIMLPLFLLFCLTTLNMWGSFLTGITIIITALLILGLYKRSEWAPILFNYYIFTSFLPVLIDYMTVRKDFVYFENQNSGFLGLTIVIWFIWSIPNYIYLNKRKALFRLEPNNYTKNSGATVVDKMKWLKEMKDDGIISEEEFQQKKEDLLKKL